MAGHRCRNCMYSVCDPDLWDRQMWMGEPILPRCANHPRWPGQLHEVPGVPCRNYRPKPVLPGGDDVRLIPLSNGFYAYVDAPDYERLCRYTWHMENGYPSRREKGKRIYLHRQIMQAPRNMVVDHIDGNRTNASRFNLRVCSPGENHRNRRKQAGSCSRFKGVVYDKRLGRWLARCGGRSRIRWLGYFDDESEAARAYDRKAAELFGQYARLNFPEEYPPPRRQQVHAQSQSAANREQKPQGKKAGRKERKTTARAKPRATENKRRGTERGTSRKVKGKSRKPHAETPSRRG